MTMAGALSVTPVRPSVRTYLRTYVCPNDVHSLTRILLIRILWNLVTLFSTISHHAFSSYGPLFMKIHHLKRCPLSKSNSFDQNFMILGYIVKYHNDPYRTMLSVVMALCLWKFTIWNDVCSLSRIFLSEFYETWSHCLVPWCFFQVR